MSANDAVAMATAAAYQLRIEHSGRNLGGHIPSCPRHVRRDAVAMATAVA